MLCQQADEVNSVNTIEWSAPACESSTDIMDGLDYLHQIQDEICLEGLDGITLQVIIVILTKKIWLYNIRLCGWDCLRDLDTHLDYQNQPNILSGSVS